MIFSASDLKDRVEIRRLTQVPDPYGGSTEEEVSIGLRWANVYAPKVVNGVIAMAEAMTVSYEVTFRMPVDIQIDDIIVWYGTRMDVQDFRPIQNRQFMSVICKTEH